MTVTLSAMHEQLRRDTAKLLGYDYAKLTAAAGVRLDRAAMLRLELDDCQTKKLAGQPFDMNKYVVASEALERLMGGDPEAPADDFEARYQARIQEEFAGAHEKLSQLLSDQAERFDAADRRESPRLRVEIAALKAEIAEKDALIEQLRSSSPSAASPPPAATQSPQPPLPPPSSAPPGHYLARHDEPWRSVTSDRWRNNNV
jgi:hypothetical protein